jgi:hypothetical protein
MNSISSTISGIEFEWPSEIMIPLDSNTAVTALQMKFFSAALQGKFANIGINEYMFGKLF